MIPDPDAQLSRLELKCRRPVEHLLAGEYRSVFRGQGIEFEDVRPYEPGDDVRTMEWKITARTGTPHVKRCIEEREQFLYLLVDLSASMLETPNGGKRSTATELCALLAMAAVRNHDRVSLTLFSDCVERVIPPGKGRSHALRIIDSLLTFRPTRRQTRFTDVLTRFGRMARKHSIAFVLSDFLADDYAEEMRALAGRHDMNAVNILNPGRHTTHAELVSMRDAESGRLRMIDLRSSRASRGGYHLRLQEQMVQAGISLMEISVGEDCVSALADFMHARQRRIADETGG